MHLPGTRRPRIPVHEAHAGAITVWFGWDQSRSQGGAASRALPLPSHSPQLPATALPNHRVSKVGAAHKSQSSTAHPAQAATFSP